MSGSNLLVAAPWIAFGVGVLLVCVRLLRARRMSARPPARSRRADPADPGDPADPADPGDPADPDGALVGTPSGREALS